MRINKFLSHKGVCSRRQADKLIEEGKVTVNGIKCETGREVLQSDIIIVNGKEVDKTLDTVLIAYYKEKGVICTEFKGEKGIKISDKIKELGFPFRLFTIGRLDKNSQGLILLTNDGDLAKELTDKSNCHEKEYIVTLNKKYDNLFLQKMENGVFLSELNKKTKKAKLKKINSTTFAITIVEGLNRQIRRMCKELGYEVIDLKRIRIDDILLEGLKPNGYREIADFN